MTRVTRAFATSAFCAAMSTLPAQADQKDSAVFDLVLKGINAGTLSVSGASNGSSYAAAGVLKTGGLVALVKKVRYDAHSSGTIRGGAFVPVRYKEDADTGKRQSQSVMDYIGGVPQLKKYSPPRKPRKQDVDPATQGGTVDPLTALYAALRDVPADQACDLQLTLFDGKRRSQVTLGEPRKSGDGLTCAGEYRRLEGFSEKEMAEKVRFPFTMTLAPVGDGVMRVMEVSMDTLYGKGALKRR